VIAGIGGLIAKIGIVITRIGDVITSRLTGRRAWEATNLSGLARRRLRKTERHVDRETIHA
jgi:hypothetical protein